MQALTLVCRRTSPLKAPQRGAEGGAPHRLQTVGKGWSIVPTQARGAWLRTNSKRTTSELKLGVARVLPRRLRCPTGEFSPDKPPWLISRAIARATTL